jgi:molybdopterin-guanine dinucleotide biosynthesis protein A
MTKALYGLVLCGGKSSRLGFPKYMIEKEGVPLYKWWLNLLRQDCEKVFISCKSTQKQDFENADIITDESDDEGPLDGIRQAFQFNPNVKWFVAACDLVQIDQAILKHLIDNKRDDRDATCYVTPETRDPFPLLTIYNPSIKPQLEIEYQSQMKSAKKLLKRSNTKLLETIHKDQLKGINTIADLEQWINSLK